MPTYEALGRFRREWAKLGRSEREAFIRARRRFVEGLSSGRLHPRLRVKRVQGHAGVWEITWAPDGRATFHYGDEVRPGEPHIVWRRIGDHSILNEP